MQNFLNNKLGRLQNETAAGLFEAGLFFQNLSRGTEKISLWLPVLGEKFEIENPRIRSFFHEIWWAYIFYDHIGNVNAQNTRLHRFIQKHSKYLQRF
jgi:hypothetical protein